MEGGFTPRRRFALGSALAVLTLLVHAPVSFEAGERPTAALQFTQLPSRALAGEAVTVAVGRAGAGARCALAVTYANGAGQLGLAPRTAIGGAASWSWTIPDSTQAAVAKLAVACGSKRISGKLLVVGSLSPPRLSVVKDGFSTRPAAFGGGTDVSYGVIIKNSSLTTDAQNVSVIVNFVLANDHLLGTNTDMISLIPAGSTYNLGDHLAFPGAAPVVRLEIVMQVGSTAPHTGHPPALDNVVIEPSTTTTDAGWVGDVAGEVINNDPTKVLESVQYSAVILDAAGNVLGGGNGSSFGTSLPPGTRVVFKLTGGGFSDIPVTEAATVLVSATPTWQQTAT